LHHRYRPGDYETWKYTAPIQKAAWVRKSFEYGTWGGEIRTGFEQWIKEGKNAIVWTRLSCRGFTANAVRLQLHTLTYNLANFMRTLALPQSVEHWSLALRDKLVKIGAKVVRHGRYVTFQLAEVADDRGGRGGHGGECPSGRTAK
jgi:Transposase DDE domain group 1